MRINRCLSAGFLFAVLSGCATYVPTPVAVYNGNPCDQAYFDPYACQLAVSHHGWYIGSIFYPLSGGYGYDHYVTINRTYITHGGRVTPYKQAVQSMNSSSKTYVPPTRQSPAASSASSSARTYTPPTQSAPAPRAYTPPSSSRSSSYSPPTRSSSRR